MFATRFSSHKVRNWQNEFIICFQNKKIDILNPIRIFIISKILSTPMYFFVASTVKGGGGHDEPRFSILKFNRLADSLQNFEYEYNYKKRS